MLIAAAVSVTPMAFAQSASPAGGLGTALVELREVEQTYPADALIEAVRQTTVAAQTPGRVLEARAEAGDRVAAGQVLMRIDQREALQVQAGAQAQLANAKASFERNKDLFARKFVSQATVDKAEADFHAASAAAGQAGAQTSYATITAPFAGVVGQRLTEPGDMAMPGKPLYSLFDPKGMRAVASIPQFQLAEVRRALRAKVELPETGLWIDAQRVELLPIADGQTHIVRARVYLPDNLPGVMPGMFVRTHFLVGKARKLIVPAAAILRRGEVTGVYVIDEKSVPHLRQVRLGEPVAGGTSQPFLEVLAGLKAGETVALDPLKAGMQLKQGGK